MDNNVDPDSDALPLSTLAQIDKICIAFEASCQAGTPSSLESLLDDAPRSCVDTSCANYCCWMWSTVAGVAISRWLRNTPAGFPTTRRQSPRSSYAGLRKRNRLPKKPSVPHLFLIQQRHR